MKEQYTHSSPPKPSSLLPEDLENWMEGLWVRQIQGTDLELQRRPGGGHPLEGESRIASLQQRVGEQNRLIVWEVKQELNITPEKLSDLPYLAPWLGCPLYPAPGSGCDPGPS